MKSRQVMFCVLGTPFFTENEFKEVVAEKGSPKSVEWQFDGSGVAYYLEVIGLNERG